jgi:mono/diheme cytochrome c family protein
VSALAARIWNGTPKVAALAAALALAGCSEQDMLVQPKLKPLQPSTFFADGQASRPVVPGTVAIGHLGNGPRFDTGEVDGKLVAFIPLKGFDPDEKLDADAARSARKATLLRGRERFNIYCAPCHGQTGEGNGMIVQRGFSKPPSFHEPRLREAPPGHYFRAITHGYGAMYSYASRIAPADRWAITAYIRALQLSQNAQPADLARATLTANRGEAAGR